MLFIPGPGFSSEPDRRVLAARLRDAGVVAAFWNERSPLRPGGLPFAPERALSAAIADLGGQLARWDDGCDVVACSLSAFTVTRLLADAEAAARIRRIVFVGPVFDVVTAHRRMLACCQSDFGRTDPDKAARIERILARAKEPYDEHFQEGLALALQDPDLLSHYFRSTDALRLWSEVVAEPQWSIDGAAMDAYLREYRGDPTLGYLAAAPETHALFGADDPVASPDDAASQLDRLFRGWTCHVAPDAGHWPHLEDPDLLLGILRG